jgi:uroporphyrinogen decarboxylase
MSVSKSKRDIVLDLVRGGSSVDYVPAAFFLHFPPEFRGGDAAVRKHEEFFRSTGMDFVKIQFEVPFPQVQIDTPKDWAKLPLLGKDFYEGQLAVVRGLVDALKSEAPVVCTLYSPYMIVNHMADPKKLAAHLAEDPDAVRKGLEIARDGLLIFVREAVKAGLDGFYHSTQGGEDRRFADKSLFTKWIKPIDLDVMREIERTCLFDILHVCDYNRDSVGGYSSLETFLDYPGHVVNVEPPTTAEDVVRQFGRPFMGGLDRRGVLATGTEDQVRKAAREALDAGPERFILGADCTVPADTPWENLRAAIDEAHKGRCR